MKKALLYILLVVLIIFLLLPVGLRMFGKDLYKDSDKDQEPKNVVNALRCNNTTTNEVVNTTYLNGSAYNFYYRIDGKFIPEEGEDTLNKEVNPLIQDIMEYAKITYNEATNVTEYSIALYSFEAMPETLKKYADVFERQSEFYDNRGFECQIDTIST